MPERDKNITELIGVVAVENKSTQLTNDDGGWKNATADRAAFSPDGTAETADGAAESANGTAEKAHGTARTAASRRKGETV